MGFLGKLSRRRRYAKMTVPELHCEAQTALRRQDIDSALEAMLLVWERTPTDPAVYMGLGICCHMNRWNATAIACFRRILDFDPNNEEAKTKIRQIKELINHTLFSHPMFKLASMGDPSFDIGTLRQHHEMEVETAYRALCQGIFDPRV